MLYCINSRQKVCNFILNHEVSINIKNCFDLFYKFFQTLQIYDNGPKKDL